MNHQRKIIIATDYGTDYDCIVISELLPDGTIKIIECCSYPVALQSK